ncbi:MAG: aldo/keto reductase [Verrucomicrobiota bacterium]
MKNRAFGREGIEISDIGLGCWQIGGSWGHVEEETARKILMASLDAGVSFFDTADVYGGGRSESIIGGFLKEARSEDLFIATKVGRMGLYPDQYSEVAIREHVEACLKRLGVESLDLVQTHCVPTEVMRQGEIYEWLKALVVEGKIKRFGASVESMEEANMLIETVDELYSLQIIFNLFRQKAIDVLFDAAKAKKVGIIARVPLASGVLSGKFTADTLFGQEDHRNFNKDGDAFNVGETFAGVPFEKAIEFADKIESLRPEGMSLAQMALRWIVDHDAVSVVIPGASKISQAIGNAEVSDLPPLSEDTHAALRKLYREEIHGEVRGVY